MVRGIYNLTSAMLTQNRRLDVVAQNMTNGSTAGYKEDTYHHISFEEHMLERIGNTHLTPGEDVGSTYFKIVSSEITTSFEQGVLEQTKLPLDFAIEGNGFFAIEWDWEVSDYNTVQPPPELDEEGNVIPNQTEAEVQEPQYDDEGNIIPQMETIVSYTRSGQFSLDEEGYLFLPNFGRVLDTNENHIFLGTDQVSCDQFGNIMDKSTGEELASLGIFVFEDNTLLERDPRGLFISADAPAVATAEDYVLHHGYVERSNTSLMEQMVKMMEAQRALQSASTVFKIYDELVTKAVTEVGRGS